MAEATVNSGAAQPKTAQGLTSVHMILAVAVAVSLILLGNFSYRIELDRSLGRIHAQFATEIESLLVEQEALLSGLNYVKSDAYVEYWARDEGKMIREGEVLILPQSVGGSVALPPANRTLFEFETTAPKPENWHLWWALFFDSPPPQ